MHTGKSKLVFDELLVRHPGIKTRGFWEQLRTFAKENADEGEIADLLSGRKFLPDGWEVTTNVAGERWLLIYEIEITFPVNEDKASWYAHLDDALWNDCGVRTALVLVDRFTQEVAHDPEWVWMHLYQQQNLAKAAA